MTAGSSENLKTSNFADQIWSCFSSPHKTLLAIHKDLYSSLRYESVPQ